LANILNNIGILNWNWGNYARALQYYLESYEMREKGADSNGAAITGNNIALLYQKLGDNENAYKHLTKALEIARKVDYKFAIGYS
jgi:tetratricopeptide (TPR) repeat protein